MLRYKNSIDVSIKMQGNMLQPVQLPAIVILPFRQNMFSEEYNLTFLLHIEVFLYIFYWQTSHITSF